MIHPLKNRLSLDVDVNPATGWGGGLSKLASVRIDGKAITGLLLEGRAPWVTKELIDKAHTLFPVVGLRFAPAGWGYYPGDAAVAAKAFSDIITRLESDGKRRVDVVEWDVETSNRTWEDEFLLGSSARGTKGIRGANGLLPKPDYPTSLGYRWGRPGVWTMEARKDASSSSAHLAAATGLLVGPQCYAGGNVLSDVTDPWFEIRTWALNNNPDRTTGAAIPLSQFLPFYPAAAAHRMRGQNEAVLFAATLLTELYA